MQWKGNYKFNLYIMYILKISFKNIEKYLKYTACFAEKLISSKTNFE